ncbi:MAG: RIP metalloprotease RseP [Acidobacteriota bacterium]
MPDPLTLLGFIFILGALIFIHESGHYMVAKALGIKVEVFSLGFGPKLFKFYRGGTEYCISALPLGGYVKMLGENPEESLQGSREEFLSRSKFERFLVLVMGATLNIILAVVLTAGIYMHGIPEPLFISRPPTIGHLDPNGGAAAAGMRVGDRILEVGGKEVPTWKDLQLAVALNPNRLIDFEILRDGKPLSIAVQVGASERDRIGIIGIGPMTEIAVARVVKGGPADTAGLRLGDIVTRIAGKELFGPPGADVLEQMSALPPGEPLTIQVKRGDRLIDVSLMPVEKDGRGDVGLGLSYATTIRRFGPVESIAQSIKMSAQQAGVLFLTLRKLVAGQMSPRALSGPIEIYRLTGESLRGGWIFFVSFMSLISLQLGIINLLPIPVLDGGHVFILLVEGIIRRDLSMKIKERVMQFGFILLLLIMGGVIYLDVVKNL